MRIKPREPSIVLKSYIKNWGWKKGVKSCKTHLTKQEKRRASVWRGSVRVKDKRIEDAVKRVKRDKQKKNGLWKVNLNIAKNK